MFGATGEKLETKLEKMMKKGEWDKIKKKYLNSTPENQAELARACKSSNSDDSCNVLIALLDSPDRNVVLEALRSIKVAGTDHAVAMLQVKQSNIPDSDAEMKTAAQEALTALRNKK